MLFLCSEIINESTVDLTPKDTTPIDVSFYDKKKELSFIKFDQNKQDHVDFYKYIYSIGSISAGHTIGHFKTENELLKELNFKNQHNDFYYLVQYHNKMIGTCSIYFENGINQIGLGYSVLPTCQNQGFGSRILASLIEQTKELKKTNSTFKYVNQIKLRIALENAGSIKIAKKNGFKIDGAYFFFERPAILAYLQLDE